MTGLAGLLSIALAVGLINGDLPSTANGLDVDSQLLDERLVGSETVLLDAEKWENENDMTQTNRSRLRKSPRAASKDFTGAKYLRKTARFRGSSLIFENYIPTRLEDYWTEHPWATSDISQMHVIPSDGDANTSDGDVGEWHPGKVSLVLAKSFFGAEYLEYSPIMGVRIGITPPSAKEDNTFINWVDMVNTHGPIPRSSNVTYKKSKIVHDTTMLYAESAVPNFRLTGFRLKRFDESRSEFKGPRNSSVNFPNKSDFIGVTDIVFYGYQEIIAENLPSTPVLRRVPAKLGPFLQCGENLSINTGSWRQRFDCPPGEHVVGFTWKSDVEGKKTFGDDSGLTGLRLLCTSGPVVPEDGTEPTA